jgi:hypothetical protein
MEQEFSLKYAFLASDSFDLIVKIAKYVGKQYMEIMESVRLALADQS